MSNTAQRSLPDKLIVALGGNAIHPAGIKGTGEEQFEIAAEASHSLLPLLKDIPQLVITHGNGPGVGKVLMRQAIASKRVATMPLDICVANSQGGISYVLMQTMQNSLQAAGVDRAVTSIICEVEVDPDDPAFENPDKPLGYFFSEAEAEDLRAEFNWNMKEDANRGWRMVVPSPHPLNIVNIDVIKNLARSGVIVITGGGGGIPVIADSGGNVSGVEAVVDKDRTAILLARELDIDQLLILTSVSHVAIHFGTDKEQNLSHVSLEELKTYLAQGHFSAGSMEPKVEAVIQFIEDGGKRATIAHLDKAYEALLGQTGTHVER